MHGQEITCLALHKADCSHSWSLTTACFDIDTCATCCTAPLTARLGCV